MRSSSCKGVTSAGTIPWSTGVGTFLMVARGVGKKNFSPSTPSTAKYAKNTKNTKNTRGVRCWPSCFLAYLAVLGVLGERPFFRLGLSRENGSMSDAFRIETDTMGEMRVPSSALYGAQSEERRVG